MRPLASIPGLATLAGAVALVCAAGGPAHAARHTHTPDPRSPLPDTAHVDRAARDLMIAHAASNQTLLRLGRAAMERSVGNMRGVIENLEAIDFSGEPSFADADRAAFLLGEAYLEVGAHSRFGALARQVATWHHTSSYTRWIAYQLALAETEIADPSRAADDSAWIALPRGVTLSGSAAADGLAAGVLLRDGDAAGALAMIAEMEARGESSPLITYLKAQALGSSGEARRAWMRLAETDTTSRLGRDLAGAALLRLATESLRRGEDARPMLARVPAGSYYASRARHMLGLASIERGDTAQGIATLEALARDDSSYAARREVWLALAGQGLDRGDWESAYHTYQEIDHDWALHRDILKRLLAADDPDSLWHAWEGNSLASPALMLDVEAGRTIARGLADSSDDLSARPDAALPELEAPALRGDSPYAVPPPPPEVWKAVAGVRRDMGETAGALALTRWEQAREDERLGSQRRYLAVGFGRARREADSLAARSSLLDSLRATLDSLDARLKAVRDEATRRIVRRTMGVLEECAGNLLWMEAMRHFHLDGPERARAVPPPASYPGPDSVLAGEERLARAIDALARRMMADAPGLIARSYQQAWRPGIIARAARQDSIAHEAWGWARMLATSIDSSIAAAASSEELRRLAARADSLAAASANLAATYARLRADGARRAVQAALANLEGEREGIDYGLAASTYGLGVRLGAPGAGDSLLAERGVSRAAGGGSDSAAVDALDEPAAVRWRAQAVTLHRAFLAQHPDSPARGEMRFRLADLLLVEARREFREQMAAYVRDQAAGGPEHLPLPVLSHAEPLALYRAMLAEDTGFEHTDAALFNAGMILADEGEPEAWQMFSRLVSEHPQSPYVQEATLRMGDMRFNEKRYAESIELYRRAAAGSDAGLVAIARYKTGWANYNQDRYAEAAEAFGAVLDLYASDRRPEIEADVEGEAETYLVHSLAGAGGARAFEAHFGRVGHKPYEQRILMALGQHFRRFGLYAEAVAVDELCLSRYPDTADALLAAQRLIDTHQRSRQPDRARAARLAFSARFAPGSAWAKAQGSDSVRTAGAEFARTSLQTVAQEYHQRARDTHAPADWRAALDLYQQVLKTWPDDPQAPSLALKAGEAATQLGDYAAALDHYEQAARAGNDSVAAQAMWQRVAVTDAWYEATRFDGGRTRALTGSDSLARAVLRNADELLARFPSHPQGADLRWRQGNLAFAHGWLDESAAHFGRLASEHPADARAPRAAILRADALFRLGRYDVAGPAYEQALVAARAARSDSLIRRAEQSMPVAYYRLAESAVAEDSAHFERHAALFQQVASGWPRYQHAPLAQYRAGLAWAHAGRPEEAVRAMEAVIDSFPKSEYVRDAHIEIARAWEKGGEKEKAAAAYARFAEHYPKEKVAADAWLKAADLYAAAGKDDHAQEIRLAYVQRYPNDVETALDVYEGLALKELKTVGPNRPISMLLPAPLKPAGKGAAGKGTAAKGASAKRAVPPSAPASYLAEYLRRAETNPKLASREILAQVSYLQAEESRPSYEALRLRLPLPTSIAARQKSLDHLMGLYKKSVDQGVPEWAHASTLRIGEALVNFGQALEQSERPHDLAGDALHAYEDVLFEKAHEFDERGENVWSELLRQKGVAGEHVKDDPWIARAQGALWQRLGDRFAYRPETDYPLVDARAAEKKQPVEEPPKKGSGRSDRSDRSGRGEKPQARKTEDHPR